VAPASAFAAPVLVSTSAQLADVVALSAEAAQTICAVTGSGKVFCWGRLEMLVGGAPGTHSAYALEMKLDSLPYFSDAKAVAATLGNACVVRQDSSLWCWGNNNVGQIGVGSSQSVFNYPTKVTALSTKVSQVMIGDDNIGPVVCARLKDGTLWCWGHNSQGLVGNGVTGGNVNSPSQVVTSLGGPAISNVTQIRGAWGMNYGFFALLADHTVWQWSTTASQTGSNIWKLGSVGGGADIQIGGALAVSGGPGCP
jgi:alpha-tubulin suppressor-like RCC1 family protein